MCCWIGNLFSVKCVRIWLNGAGLQGNESRHLFSSYPLLPAALPIPHPNKQTIYRIVKFCSFYFFIHPFKYFAAVFQKTLLFNIQYTENSPSEMFFLKSYSVRPMLVQQWTGHKRTWERKKGSRTLALTQVFHTSKWCNFEER